MEIIFNGGKLENVSITFLDRFQICVIMGVRNDGFHVSICWVLSMDISRLKYQLTI